LPVLEHAEQLCDTPHVEANPTVANDTGRVRIVSDVCNLTRDTRVRALTGSVCPGTAKAERLCHAGTRIVLRADIVLVQNDRHGWRVTGRLCAPVASFRQHTTWPAPESVIASAVVTKRRRHARVP
jgi:hypothetical protein